MTKCILQRLLDIAYRNKLSHLGSCLTSIDIIYNIYAQKAKDDIFILSNGHAGLALYCVLEHFFKVNAEELLHKHGIHPCYDKDNFIDCSTGSLGLGLLIGIGHALGNKQKHVHVLISDGECVEGSIWEGLRFIYEKNITNISVYVNANGYCAYDKVNIDYLTSRLKTFLPSINIFNTNVDTYPFLQGVDAHYYVMTEEDKNYYEKTIC